MAAAPRPNAELRKLARRYADPGKATALEMLAAGPPMREVLREYEDRCVRAARDAGATWAEIGDAVGMARTNAERKFRHVEQERKAARD